MGSAEIHGVKRFEQLPTVLFYRHYDGFSGGQLKLYDYVCHVNASGFARSRIFIDPTSISSDHLWHGYPGLVYQYNPESADLLFLAGTDWRALDAYPKIEERIPVINLIQSLRHANPDFELYSYLTRKATRVCVSHEVADAIRSTGICNGPVHVIENGTDFSLLPNPQSRNIDVCIIGHKRPELAYALGVRLEKYSIQVECLTETLPREIFLQKLVDARIVVALPYLSEGFYLPALEAMLLGSALICPDCIGNRRFCIPNVTCLMPDHSVDGFEDAVTKLLSDDILVQNLVTFGIKTSRKFSIERERSQFTSLLSSILFSKPLRPADIISL